jgi:hypothetical protein
VQSVQELFADFRGELAELVLGLLTEGKSGGHDLTAASLQLRVQSLDTLSRNVPTVPSPSLHLGDPFGRIVFFNQFEKELIPGLAPCLASLKPMKHICVDGNARHRRSHHDFAMATMVFTIRPNAVGPKEVLSGPVVSHPDSSWEGTRPAGISSPALGAFGRTTHCIAGPAPEETVPPDSLFEHQGASLTFRG